MIFLLDFELTNQGKFIHFTITSQSHILVYLSLINKENHYDNVKWSIQNIEKLFR